MKVWLENTPHERSGGLYRVVDGLYSHLPVEIVANQKDADVYHYQVGIYDRRLDKPSVVSSHGLYWKEHNWGNIANKVNKECISSYVKADVVTAPSFFTARAISRHSLADPVVVHHGIDSNEWIPGTNSNYVLWNKARVDVANNPQEMNTLASMDHSITYVSTYGKEAPNVSIIGLQSPFDMKTIVANAGVYLDTAKESGGPCFGVLEAMSCAVPVLSWDFGGTSEVIVHKSTGYLARPYDYDDLLNGIRYCFAHRDRLGANAREDVINRFQWSDVIEGYLTAYNRALQHQNETVSVIIPCYNLGKFLPGCLDSVLAQTYQDIEIIVVDDASTDNTQEILQEYPEVTVIANTTNQHVSESRNLGIFHSRGKYILPLDADDRLYPDAIANLRAGQADIVGGKLKIFHESQLDGEGFDSGWPNDADRDKQVMGHNRLPYASMYTRKVWERVGGYRTRIRNGVEDADFWTRALSYGYSAEIIDKYTLKYTQREGSLGKQNNRGADAYLDWFPWRYAPARAPYNTTDIGSQSPAKVSIVVPVGPGHSKYIRACMDSIIAQSEQDIEVIIINDTGQKWGESSRHLLGTSSAVVIDNEHNMGVAWARNRGIEAASSNNIVFLDVDDTLQPLAVEALLAAKAVVGGWVYGDWYINNGTENITYNESEDWNLDLLKHRSICPITGIYDKSHCLLVGGFTEDAPGWEDWDFHLKLAERGICGTRIKIPLITYNMHLGLRREQNFNSKESLVQYIHTKFKESTMACSSCGGKNTVIIRQSAAKAPVQDETVTLMYVGPEKQSQRVRPPIAPKREYRFKQGRPFPVLRIHAEFFLRKVTSNGPLYVEVETPKAVVASDNVSPLVSQDSAPDLPDIPKISPLSELGLPDKLTNLLAKQFACIETIMIADDNKLLSISGIGTKSVELIRDAIDTWKSLS